jgi:hypothetical protein
MYCVAQLAVLTAGIVGARFAPGLHATASHTAPHLQLADACPASGAHCPYAVLRRGETDAANGPRPCRERSADLTATSFPEREPVTRRAR